MTGIFILSCLLALSSNLWSAQGKSSKPSAKALVEQASAAFDKGDYEKTVTLCKKAISADPKYVRAYTWLGTAYAKQDKKDLAREAFKKVLALEPKGPDADKAREWLKELEGKDGPAASDAPKNNAPETNQAAAVACPKCGKLTDANGAFCKHCGTKLNPTPTDTEAARLTQEGYQMLKRRQFDEAEQTFKRALALDPKYAPAHNGMGNVFFARNDLNASEQAYKRAIDFDPKLGYVHSNLGNVYFNQKRYAEAEASYKQALALNFSDPNLYNRMGTICYDQKRYDEAERFYKRAIEIDPKLGYLHYNLGNVYFYQKRYDDAIQEYRESLRVDENAPAFVGESLDRALKAKSESDPVNVAYQLLVRNKFTEAETKARQAIAQDTRNAKAHAILGNALVEQDNFRDGDSALRYALSLDPNCSLAHTGFGILLQKQDRCAEADQAYRRAINLDPNNALALNNLGFHHHIHGRLSEAERELKRAVQADPQLDIPYGNLGALYADQRKWSDAETNYRKAIQIEPKNGHYHGRLSFALFSQGRRQEALNEARQALRLGLRDPNFLQWANGTFRGELD
jgi:Tfp pilus assembly protein PilF